MMCDEKHARLGYLVTDDPVHCRKLRLVSLDSRIDSSREYGSFDELFHDIWDKQTPLNAVGPVDAKSETKFLKPLPVVTPLFGKSGNKTSAGYLSSLRQLSATMYGSGPDGEIPVGYTYLGQFIAHEICRSHFVGDIGKPINEATFAIDLASIYSNVPVDGLHILTGKTTRHDAPFDINRTSTGCPLVGNSRNDSNLALSQMHCAFIRFHNAVADSGLFTRFEDIMHQVIMAAQAIILHDWLKKLCSEKLVENILSGNRYTEKGKLKLCPAEAVLAAFRCGHSMVRHEYLHWNAYQSSAASINGLLKFTFAGGGLEDGKMPWSWPVNWRGFFGFDDNQLGYPMRARRIDTIVDERLERLDQRLFEIEPQERSLAYRTLWFGAEAQISDGWSVQKQLACTVGDAEFPMRCERLVLNRPDLDIFFRKHGDLSEHPPLWWFILREAELYGVRGGLAGVGARLVAETVFSAIEATTPSILAGGRIHPALPGGYSLPPTMPNMLSWGGQPLDWYSEGYNYHG
jgi:hypothetical protein